MQPIKKIDIFEVDRQIVEYNLIQQKKSNLTKRNRDIIVNNINLLAEQGIITLKENGSTKGK